MGAQAEGRRVADRRPADRGGRGAPRHRRGEQPRRRHRGRGGEPRRGERAAAGRARWPGARRGDSDPGARCRHLGASVGRRRPVVLLALRTADPRRRVRPRPRRGRDATAHRRCRGSPPRSSSLRSSAAWRASTASRSRTSSTTRRRRPDDAPAPVVVHVHGGPEHQAFKGYNATIQALVAAGYAVVAPNVRGSTGYGRRYAGLDDTTRRLDSVRDLAAIHDALGGLGLDPGSTSWGSRAWSASSSTPRPTGVRTGSLNTGRSPMTASSCTRPRARPPGQPAGRLPAGDRVRRYEVGGQLTDEFGMP